MQADQAKAPDPDNQSNRKGWRGPYLNLERTEPWIPLAAFVRQALKSILAPEVDYSLVSPGVNVHLEGGFNLSHVHSNCLVSAVDYIACPPGGGAIVFEDPRVQAAFADFYPLFCQNQGAPQVEMTPHEGLLVLFPSWLSHWVEPSAASEPRISLPINCCASQ